MSSQLMGHFHLTTREALGSQGQIPRSHNLKNDLVSLHVIINELEAKGIEMGASLSHQ